MRSPPPRPPSARRPLPSSTTFAALVAGAAVAYSVAACNSPSSLELGCPLSPLALDAPPYAALGAAVAGAALALVLAVFALAVVAHWVKPLFVWPASSRGM